jgi:hypothetical protein
MRQTYCVQENHSLAALQQNLVSLGAPGTGDDVARADRAD